MEIRLEEEFREFLKSLKDNDVKYLLIGGYAVILNGHIRNTMDLDIAIAPSDENADRMVKALKDFGFDVPNLSVDLFTKPRNVVRMGFPPIKIEIINYLEGVAFEKAHANRRLVNFEGLEISLIDVHDLIANKKAVGRPQDLADIAKLQELHPE
jgi:predicted nucleotidyltransferase